MIYLSYLNYFFIKDFLCEIINTEIKIMFVFSKLSNNYPLKCKINIEISWFNCRYLVIQNLG